MKNIKVERIDLKYPEPEYKSSHASGMDLCAYTAIDMSREGVDLFKKTTSVVYIPPHSKILFGTGLMCNIPDGYELQIRPRSGLALKKGLVASFGTIDADYHGEIKVILYNIGNFIQSVKKGERIAQAVLAPVYRAQFEVVEKFSESYERGENGFGSTGSH